MGEVHQHFVLTLSLVWFARATPEKNDLASLSLSKEVTGFSRLLSTLLAGGEVSSSKACRDTPWDTPGTLGPERPLYLGWPKGVFSRGCF